jgi:hypothetical protein
MVTGLLPADGDVPLATTVNVAVWPATTVRDAGWVVMTGEPPSASSEAVGLEQPVTTVIQSKLKASMHCGAYRSGMALLSAEERKRKFAGIAGRRVWPFRAGGKKRKSRGLSKSCTRQQKATAVLRAIGTRDSTQTLCTRKQFCL